MINVCSVCIDSDTNKLIKIIFRKKKGRERNPTPIKKTIYAYKQLSTELYGVFGMSNM